MTASWTVPFLIVPSGEASLTATLIRSPRLAIFPVEPPIGIIISTRRAPELSATSREVCIWITCRYLRLSRRSLLRSFLNYLNHTPTLTRRKRTRFHNSHLVANRRTEFVVGHELRRAAHVTAVLRMTDQPVHPHDHGLRHLVRRDRTDLLRTIRTRFGGYGCCGCGACAFNIFLILSHYFLFSISN